MQTEKGENFLYESRNKTARGNIAKEGEGVKNRYVWGDRKCACEIKA
jgi:hypothetical protein